MTPKQCPQCTNLVDEASVRCPICGQPFEMEYRPANPYTTPSIPGIRHVPEMGSPSGPPWAIIGGVVAVLALAAVAFVFMFKGQQAASSELQTLSKWYAEPKGVWVSSDIDLSSLDGMGQANIYCVSLDDKELRVRKGEGVYFASKGGAFDSGFKITTPIEFTLDEFGPVQKTAGGWANRSGNSPDGMNYTNYSFALGKDPGTAALTFERIEQNNVVDKGKVTLIKAKGEATQMKHVQEALARHAAFKKGEIYKEPKKG